MPVPDATIIALTNAFDGLNMSDGDAWPVGYHPCKQWVWMSLVTNRDQRMEEGGGEYV